MAPTLIEVELAHVVLPQGGVNSLEAIPLQNNNSRIFLVEDMEKPLTDKTIAADSNVEAMFLQKV